MKYLDILSYSNKMEQVKCLDLAYEKFMTAQKIFVNMTLDGFT